MSLTLWVFLPVAFLLAALLYSSVGHAGASGYLAIIALFAIAPQLMKPTALALNILVGTIASIKFYRAGCFSSSKFWPFALASVPCSFIGGMLSLPGYLYKPVVGLVLLYAAYRMFRASQSKEQRSLRPIPLWAGLGVGAGIGLLSGLTGVASS